MGESTAVVSSQRQLAAAAAKGKPNKRHDISYHPGQVVLYAVPHQRQTWDDEEVHPRVNWGDLFFDLFYVAAAYNTGSILLGATTGRGVLYFVGTLWPVIDMWRAKVMYDCRFVVNDDLYHRVVETMLIVVVATAVVHIGPVDVLSNTRDNIDMFVFSLAQVIYLGLQVMVALDLYFFGKGQPLAVKSVALWEIRQRVAPLLLYIAAMTVAALDYFGNNNEDDKAYDDDHHRSLAGSTTATASTFQNDIPIWLCAGASLSSFLYLVISVQCLFPNDGSHKKFTVPLNIDFLIHRNGEWIMLMLGESVLSLLIVDVTEGRDYYTTFYCGLLTVILHQYLHFRSQPHSPKNHATRRNKDAGVWWGFFNQVYSSALIVVGVSFKLFLYEFGYVTTARRQLATTDEFLAETPTERFLAGASAAAAVSGEVRRQSIANLFCGGMATVWFSLDAMLLLHRGWKASLGRLKCEKRQKTKIKGVLLLLTRAAVVVFFATLSRYETDPNQLAAFGLGGVSVQIVLRRFGGLYFAEDHSHGGGHKGDDTNGHHDPEHGKWPNVTHAVARPAAHGEKV